MAKKSKKFAEALKQIEKGQMYTLTEAVDLVKRLSYAKFDETIEAHFHLGIDCKKSDQNIRGTIVLPHGTGKTLRICVITKADKIEAAEQAGADVAGFEDVIAKIKSGWSDFDICIATPDVMGVIGKELGRVLGPRMPNPKSGTVTPDLPKTISEFKKGKLEYRNDKHNCIHSVLGKVSFDAEKIEQNFRTLFDAILKARPVAVKGTYVRSIYLTSSMGPSISVDVLNATQSTAAAAR
ncbi:MAG: 50S ribosomal protein L1 [Candidatus Bruticola sp.]